MQRGTAACCEQEFDTLGNPPEKQTLNLILWLGGSQVCPCAVIGMRDVHQNLEGLPELHRPHPTLCLLHQWAIAMEEGLPGPLEHWRRTIP